MKAESPSESAVPLADLPKNAIAKIGAHKFKRQKNEHYVDEEWCSERLLEEEDVPRPDMGPVLRLGSDR